MVSEFSPNGILCNSKKETNNTKTEWYGVKSSKTRKQVKELLPFENDLIALIQNIRFRKTRNHFQLIKSSDKTVSFADKTINLYRLTKAEYDHMINNAITSKYKKASNNIKKQIVLNRLEVNGENNNFITLKDHKENFNNNPTVRLINPAKNELERISKAILDTTNKNIRETMGLNQWRNTDTVIDWFKGIHNKQLCKFVAFDIEEFCPSITENLLKKAFNFCHADDDKAIIHHARKSLLFKNQQTWIKRESGLFDVTMGAEVCELVGNYFFYEISTLYEKKDIRLYRDDGLGVFKNKSGPESEKN